MAVGKLKVVVDAVGHGTVLLNDQDISNYIRGFSIDATVGELTQVNLDVLATVDIDLQSADVITTTKSVIIVDNTSIKDAGYKRRVLRVNRDTITETGAAEISTGRGE